MVFEGFTSNFEIGSILLRLKLRITNQYVLHPNSSMVNWTFRPKRFLLQILENHKNFQIVKKQGIFQILIRVDKNIFVQFIL